MQIIYKFPSESTTCNSARMFSTMNMNVNPDIEHRFNTTSSFGQCYILCKGLGGWEHIYYSNSSHQCGCFPTETRLVKVIYANNLGRPTGNEESELYLLESSVLSKYILGN